MTARKQLERRQRLAERNATQWKRRKVARQSGSFFERSESVNRGEPCQNSEELPEVWLKLIGGGMWEVQEHFHFHFQADGLPELEIHIEAGYQFDLASVPRFAWRIVAPFELGSVAPLVHDRLYELKGVLPGNAPVSRKEADLIFREIMKMEGVKKWRRNVAYWALRIGGARWKKRKK